MSTNIPGLPQPGEYSGAFALYVGKAESAVDPVRKLNDQLDETLSFFQSLDPSRRLYRYAPGKWSIQEMLGHIIDTERIFAYRAMRIARADQTPLPGFEQDPYVAAAEAERCDWDELLDEFEHVRKASILMLKHLPEAAWARMGISSGAPLSVRAMAYIMIGHVAHHLAILRERYTDLTAASSAARSNSSSISALE
jgi:hypothetical protein